MGKIYQRWNIHHRWQHILLFTSFILLTFTGLPIKYAYKSWAVHVTSIFGGFETMFIIHKIAAIVMIIAAVYHLGYLAYCWLVKKQSSKAMIPGWKDVTDLLDHIVYCLGMSKKDAQFDRYSYKEKFDYWAVFWGIAIMVGSGLMMWFPGVTAHFVSRSVLDCAQVAHSDEAMLAIMAVFIWHFYNVHFSPQVFPMNKVWIDGKFSKAEMEEFHPLELERDEVPVLESDSESTAVSEHGRFRSNPVLIVVQMIVYAAILIWFLVGFLPLGLM
ncbi:MAG: cytochrome b/b6 domain-containing protein [Syntrophomonadaceae bacterium]|nr:cytochrome b/b6 domain-containing protein [Syntrophomonadaceae bacterium]MDD3889561.1 cytochrome b/b6 domain-containing protein [Syntrophomonadaceae bacterium]MDD4550131.1 cytochrome b/b6 domain-containing protein [Syntrophomonadaceae bacterium]